MCSNVEKEKYLRLLVQEVRTAIKSRRRGLVWNWLRALRTPHRRLTG